MCISSLCIASVRFFTAGASTQEPRREDAGRPKEDPVDEQMQEICHGSRCWQMDLGRNWLSKNGTGMGQPVVFRNDHGDFNEH